MVTTKVRGETLYGAGSAGESKPVKSRAERGCKLDSATAKERGPQEGQAVSAHEQSTQACRVAKDLVVG